MWTLRQGDTLLGSIEVTGGDVPWRSGGWAPEPAFAEVASLFDRELALLEGDASPEDWARAYSAIWDAGIRLWAPGGEPVDEFLVHIVGDTAWFRSS